MSSEVILKIYIIDGNTDSERALADLRRVCEDEFEDRYSLEIVDVLKHPHLAEKDKIMAVPTVLKTQPEPTRRIVGSLSDREKVLLALDLTKSPDSS